jgi:type I restriction enzyme S subunit
MQKFRPKGNEDGIPVLKIKELGQGKCDASSDLCSSSIPEEYIINNGDIVFSWSGTLLVDIWCSGICGLNQHLFKVSPLNYPKWLIYFWTKYHLSNFIRIAQDKAVTMGHIKRGDLDAAKVIIPSAESLNELDKIMSPMLQSIISNRIENNNLSTLRDTLLPKLMSGEIKI